MLQFQCCRGESSVLQLRLLTMKLLLHLLFVKSQVHELAHVHWHSLFSAAVEALDAEAVVAPTVCQVAGA